MEISVGLKEGWRLADNLGRRKCPCSPIRLDMREAQVEGVGGAQAGLVEAETVLAGQASRIEVQKDAGHGRRVGRRSVVRMMGSQEGSEIPMQAPVPGRQDPPVGLVVLGVIVKVRQENAPGFIRRHTRGKIDVSGRSLQESPFHPDRSGLG